MFGGSSKDKLIIITIIIIIKFFGTFRKLDKLTLLYRKNKLVKIYKFFLTTVINKINEIIKN